MAKLPLTVDRESKAPLYEQVGQAICGAIADGRLSANDKLPTQVELARSLRLNPLTVGRGYGELRKRGVLIQRRGAGTFVSPDAHSALGIPIRRRLENVAFIFASPTEDPAHAQLAPPQVEVLSGVCEVLDRAHVNLCYFPFEPSEGRLSDKQRARLATFDGIIAQLPVSDSTKCEELLLGCLQLEIPCVMFWYPSPLPSVPSVTYDRRRAAYIATEHLIRCGYERIGYVGSFTGTSAETKLLGFGDALRHNGLNHEARFSVEAEYRPGLAYAQITRRIAGGDLPDAFFVATETKAAEAVHALQEHGLSVPGDIGVCGFDDSALGRNLDPPLTTVYTCHREIGQHTAETLMNWPTDGGVPESVVLQPELRVRGTTRVIESLIQRVPVR